VYTLPGSVLAQATEARADSSKPSISFRMTVSFDVFKIVELMLQIAIERSVTD
jgi:hypothetical protein